MKQVFYIKSEQLAEPLQTVLLFEVGERHCCFGVMNHISKELTEFGYYTSENDDEDLTAGVFEKHPELSQSFSTSMIGYDLTESILFPSSQYKYEEAQLHLQAVYGINAESKVESEHLPHLRLFNTYRVPQSLHDSLSKRFATGKYWHKYSVHLKNISPAISDSLVVDFKTDEITVLALKASGLQLAQTFQYASPEDVLYYLLKTCQQFSLSQQEVNVELSGFIEKDSSIFRELYKYFLLLDFVSLPKGIKLAEAFSEYPSHYFSSICKLATCV